MRQAGACTLASRAARTLIDGSWLRREWQSARQASLAGRSRKLLQPERIAQPWYIASTAASAAWEIGAQYTPKSSTSTASPAIRPL